MISIAIVEDEATFAQMLFGYVRRYADETHLPLQAEIFPDGASFLDEHRGRFQIVFMDIVMPHMDGLSAARRLRESDRNACLIFITSMAQYAIRGYEVSALDFVIKPLAYDLFKIKLEKAIAHVRREETFPVRSSGELHKLLFSQIQYVESNKHYLYFHTDAETYRMRGSMRDIMQIFPPHGFAFAGSSLLVNLSYVDQAKGNELVVAGIHLPVARAYKQDLWEKLTIFMNGGVLK